MRLGTDAVTRLYAGPLGLMFVTVAPLYRERPASQLFWQMIKNP